MTGSQMVNPERLRSLLHSLSLLKLDKAHAGELKRLLLEELAKEKNDLEHEKELEALIKILDSYISGQIDLMLHALSPNKTKY